MHCMIVIIGLLPLGVQGMQEKLSDHHGHIHLINLGCGCLGFRPYEESG